MNAVDKELYLKWVAKAEEDLLAATRLMRDEPLASVVCFHCQQAAEKYLKALLALHGRSAPKIHDVETLAAAAMDLVPPLADVLTPARRDRKSTRLNSSHIQKSRMPSSA